jgi:hypothetical protein
MARVISVPWASNLDKNLPGVSYETQQVSATIQDSTISAEAQKVSFANLQAVLAFFNGEDNLVEFVTDSVNSWFKQRALNKARGASPEAAINSIVTGLVRAFVKRYGREPDTHELAKIRAKAALAMEEM